MMKIIKTEFDTVSIAILKMDTEIDYRILIEDKSSIEDIINTVHKSKMRKQQLLATRYLLQQLLGKDNGYRIDYTPHGKPFIKDSEYEISISHTKEFIAMIISKGRRVGVDIEIFDDRILRIEKKFIRDDEREFLSTEHFLEQVYIIWSTKETLFKIHERGGLIFKENLVVHPFEYCPKGTLTAEIVTVGNRKKYLVNYELVDELLLVYSVED